MQTRYAACALVALLAFAGPARADEDSPTVKIGVLDDMSGVNADLQGPGDVVATRMAVEDFGGTVLGKKIEVLSADLLNKTDVGVGIARRWYDVDKVDLIAGLGHSGVAIAVQQLAHERGKVTITTSAGSTDLTGRFCSPTGIHWVYDTYALAKGTATAVMRQGGKSWFFVTSDYAFGQSLEENAAAIVTAAGGKALGHALHPQGTSDFSSYLLQAQASGAQVVGFANSGGDLSGAVKQAHEFGLTANGQKLAGLLTLLTDVKALGLETAQGLMFTEAFYWDQNDDTRAFSKRFQDRHGKPPTMFQAGIYSAVAHWLKAVKAAGTVASGPVMAKMRAIPVNDFMTHDGSIRSDGRMLRDMYLLQAKTPAESKGEWDLMKVVATIPAADAWRPLSEGGCPLAQ
jgi:branched-chain amino acid transport system substrate-binding protein